MNKSSVLENTSNRLQANIKPRILYYPTNLEHIDEILIIGEVPCFLKVDNLSAKYASNKMSSKSMCIVG